tara:strand:+ start:148 stop:294 length:147 start_codon:yes stop_codon:yes gene_type:complete
MDHRILDDIEPQDIDEFLRESSAIAEKLGVNLEYYLDEFILEEDDEYE